MPTLQKKVPTLEANRGGHEVVAAHKIQPPPRPAFGVGKSTAAERAGAYSAAECIGIEVVRQLDRSKGRIEQASSSRHWARMSA
jgi:hypothetical protein